MKFIEDFLNPQIVIERKQRKEIEYRYLKFVSFKDLKTWGVQSLLKKNDNNFHFTSIRLSDVLTQIKNFETLESEKDYKLIGIRSYGGGIFLREIKKGKEIKALKLNQIKDNQFIYSRLGANLGSFAIVSNEFEGCYVSNEFPIFSIDISKLYPNFLQILFKIPYYWQEISQSLTGSALKRYKEEKLLNLEIPLPLIEVQKALVESYSTKINEAKEKEERANILEAEIETYLKTALGIETEGQEEKQSKYKYLKFIPFSKLSRWDIDYNKHIASGVFNFVSKYRIGKLSDVIQYIQYGTSNKANLENGISVLRMNNILKGELDLKDIKYIDNLEEKEVKSLILNKGDILFNRTNGKELVGKTCVFDVEGEYVFASYLIRISLNEKANPYFINYLFASSVIRNQIDAISRQITGQANVNSVEMSNLLFPLPPIEVQREIAGVVAKMKVEIKLLRSEAESLKSYAKHEFEKSVFN